MTSIFDDVRLPEWVENGASGGPVFNTNIQTLGSGVEIRNQNWSYPRHSYDIGYGVAYLDPSFSTDDTLELVRAFFYARRGMARAFRFKDWSDFSATATLIPTGGATGACTVPLVKTYTDSANNQFQRPITRLANGGTIQFYVNGTPTSYATCINGLASFTDLPSGVLTATYEFDVPVRFDTDVFSLTIDNIQTGNIASLPVIEVVENAYTLNGQTIP